MGATPKIPTVTAELPPWRFPTFLSFLVLRFCAVCGFIATDPSDRPTPLGPPLFAFPALPALGLRLLC